jgi:LmbE family N-acetylglucosaminyl deacetylase
MDSLDKNSVLVICAHSDDQIFGPGGTIAKYAKEGKKVYTVIFSYGEQSHPWYQKTYTISTRVRESIEVDKLIGGRGVIFLGLSEGKFLPQFKEKKMYPKLKKLIEKYQPYRIFTHSLDDPLPDHRALNKCVMETIDKMKYTGEVYMFDVWNVFNFKKQNYVSIAIDISDTFKTKLKALKLFKSQIGARFMLTSSVYWKAWMNGKKNGFKYAEVFYKIR